VVPLGFNYLRGIGPHRLELGVQYFFVQHQALEGGRTVFNPFDPNEPVIPVFDDTVLVTNRHQLINLRVGYRYQKPQGGFFFRAGITPVNWFLAGRENYTFGAAGLVFKKGLRNNVVFFPVPDISIGWSF